MNETQEKLIKLVKMALGISEEEKDLVISKEEKQEILRIAKMHDLSHLVYATAEKLGDAYLIEKSEQEYLKVINRRVKQDLSLKEIREIFEKEEIDFIPLKGAIICSLYPERWMRNSADIDILVREKDYDRAVEVLVDQSYKSEGPCRHHTKLINNKEIQIEIHRLVTDSADTLQINENEFVNEIWKTSVPVRKGRQEYAMTDEHFYLYHIVHMVDHFERGGCGIKFFIDLWYMNNQPIEKMCKDYVAKRDVLLKKYRCKKFEQAAIAFSKMLLEEKEDSKLNEFSEYIFNAGNFGTRDQRAKYQSLKYGGKKKYFFKKIFLSYEDLKWSYPILKKYPILTPVCEVLRWFKLIFKDKRLDDIEFQTALNADEESLESIKKVKELVGL